MFFPRIPHPTCIRNILRHPHGRRMFCGIIALSDPAPWTEAFFNEFQSLSDAEKAEIRNLLSDASPYRTNIGGMVREGFITQCSLDTGTDSECVFRAFENLASDGAASLDYVPGLPPEYMDVMELANPIIESAAVVELFNGEFTSQLAKTVLSLNPNAPDGMVPREERNRHFLRENALIANDVTRDAADPVAALLAAAKYGNLSDPDVCRALHEHIIPGSMKSEHRKRVIELLSRRNDISDETAGILDRVCDTEAYRELCKSEAHKRLRSSQDSRSFDGTLRQAFRKGEVFLSPEASGDLVEKAFNMLNASAWQSKATDHLVSQAKIALHPNAPKNIVETALAAPDIRAHMMARQRIHESPHAEAVIVALQDNGDACDNDNLFLEIPKLRNPSPEALLWAIKHSTACRENGQGQENDTAILSHPNFPWNLVPGDDAKTRVAPIDYCAVKVAVALSGSPDCDAGKALNERDYSAEVLFDPRLSAWQLEKIAEKHPQIATWCAIHPNAEGLISRVSPEKRPIVERFNSKFAGPVLAGRTGTYVSSVNEL